MCDIAVSVGEAGLRRQNVNFRAFLALKVACFDNLACQIVSLRVEAVVDRGHVSFAFVLLGNDALMTVQTSQRRVRLNLLVRLCRQEPNRWIGSLALLEVLREQVFGRTLFCPVIDIDDFAALAIQLHGPQSLEFQLIVVLFIPTEQRRARTNSMCVNRILIDGFVRMNELAGESDETVTVAVSRRPKLVLFKRKRLSFKFRWLLADLPRVNCCGDVRLSLLNASLHFLLDEVALRHPLSVVLQIGRAYGVKRAFSLLSGRLSLLMLFRDDSFFAERVQRLAHAARALLFTR